MFVVGPSSRATLPAMTLATGPRTVTWPAPFTGKKCNFELVEARFMASKASRLPLSVPSNTNVTGWIDCNHLSGDRRSTSRASVVSKGIRARSQLTDQALQRTETETRSSIIAPRVARRYDRTEEAGAGSRHQVRITNQYGLPIRSQHFALECRVVADRAPGRHADGPIHRADTAVPYGNLHAPDVG